MSTSSRAKQLLATGLVLGSIYAISVQAAQAPLTTGFYMASTTFQDGGMLPIRTANVKTDAIPFCVGRNVSPQLSWGKPYPGVKSYALTMVDLEDIINDTDLVVYGIPANVTSFAEGELSKPSDKFVGGKNSRGLSVWRGMCPPPGTSPHHYAFTLRGTDLDSKALPPGLTSAELDAALKGHTRGTTAIVGTFVHP